MLCVEQSRVFLVFYLNVRMRISNFFKLLVCILIPLGVGGFAGMATANGIDSWYITLVKPSFNPPNAIFAPVWTFLYLLMGISFYLVIQSARGQQLFRAYLIFGGQLLLNFIWSFLFFYFQEIGWALAEIVLLWLSILGMIVFFHGINKTAAYLLIPYLCWVSFATFLNFTLYQLN